MDITNKGAQKLILQYLLFEVIPPLKGSTKLVILNVYKKTIGFGKRQDQISRKDFYQKGCKSSVLSTALEDASSKKFIEVLDHQFNLLSSPLEREKYGRKRKLAYYRLPDSLLQKVKQWIEKKTPTVTKNVTDSYGNRDSTVTKSVSINSSNEYSIIPIKDKGIYQWNFVVNRVKQLLPSLSEPEILQLINRFPDKDIISASKEVRDYIEQGGKVWKTSGYLSTIIESKPSLETTQFRKVIKKHIQESFYTGTPPISVPDIGESTEDVSLRIAKVAANSSLHNSTGVVCDKCGRLGITSPMFIFANKERDGQILCNKCSNADVFIKEIMEKRNKALDS